MDDRAELAVPALREVPDEVRDRVAARVLGAERGGTRRDLAVLGVAAAAVGLMVAAVGVWGSDGGAPGGPSVGVAGQGMEPVRALGVRGEAPLDEARTEAVIDRCWAAATEAGASVPDRDEWTALFQATNGLVTVTAVRAAGTALFCETTRATVTVSDPAQTPAYVEGSRTAALLSTPNGTVAGLLDPAWPGARVAVTAPSKDRYEADVVHEDGLFAHLSVIAPDNAAATTIRPAGDEVERVLPKAGPPLVAAALPVDRSSERGRFLDACIEQARAHRVVPDAMSWAPGATAAGTSGSRVVMAVNDGGVGACFLQKERTDFIAIAAPSATDGAAVKTVPVTPTVDGQPLITGTTSRDAARVEIELPDGTVLPADLANDTFAVLLPADATDAPRVVCRVHAADGSIIYQGPLT